MRWFVPALLLVLSACGRDIPEFGSRGGTVVNPNDAGSDAGTDGGPLPDAGNDAGPSEICINGFDDDGDGLTDCADPDCAGDPACQFMEICTNGIDDDRDGFIDCNDPDCVNHPACAPQMEICDNGIDDDGDGFFDCADRDCMNHPACRSEICTNGIDDDNDGFTDCADLDCFNHPNCQMMEICDNGIDDDGDGRVDCFDRDCRRHPACQPGGEICVNGQDDDGDGLIDCQDPDCQFHPACNQPENCVDNIDNDGDGLIDCVDPDCFGHPVCGGTENCIDGQDNDGDGLIDCMDPDCFMHPVCGGPENCTNGVDDDGDTLRDCQDPDCFGHPACVMAENCVNGVDDDGDGLIDCVDPDCIGHPFCGGTENCIDGIDNDGDGQIDCMDPDCFGHPVCGGQEFCTNGIDDDGDGLIDCIDPDCQFHPACMMQEICFDGQDNDGDGLIDCLDPDCQFHPACNMPEDCVNGIDDDGDNLVDCQDPDCQFHPACMPPPVCPQVVIGSAVGQGVSSGNTANFPDSFAPQCGAGGSGDVSVEWIAPESARYTFDTIGSAYDTILHIRSGGCNGPTLGCDDDGVNPGGASRLRIDVMAGQLLILIVDGWGGSVGPYQLNITPSEVGFCTDGIDNDGDNQTDCADPECAMHPACQIETLCNDGQDNDGDGLTDCLDPDCAGDPNCAPMEVCDNGVDDDGDNQVDCDDPDCFGTMECIPFECIDQNLGSATGMAVASGTTVGAGDDTTPSCIFSTAPDVGFRWTAPSSGTFQFDLVGTQFDAVISVIGVDCLGPELACDDAIGLGGDTVNVPLNAGDQVVINVDGFATQAGQFQLNITGTEAGQCADNIDNDNDNLTDCADPDCAGDIACISCPDAALSGFGTVSMGTTVGQVDDLTPSCVPFGNAEDLSFTWTATLAGTYTFDLSGTQYDAVLEIRDAACNGPVLACEDAFTPGGEVADVNLTNGQTVVVIVDGWAGQSGPYTLNVNPACPDADLGNAPGMITVNDTTANRFNRLSGSCGGFGAPEIAYRFVPMQTRDYLIDTTGSLFDTVLYVLQGDQCGNMELDCNDNGFAGVTSQLIVPMVAGQPVVIVVDGAGGNSGNFTLNITPL